MARQSHIPYGDPCLLCGFRASQHRVDHEPVGDPCERCRVPARNHRVREHTSNDLPNFYIGIDGEGQTDRKTLNHRYVMLAANNRDDDLRRCIEAPPGQSLSTVDCLEFILGLPTARTKIFSFAFNYDLTKLLADVDDETLYKLFRPELRPRYHEPIGSPCRYCGKLKEDHMVEKNPAFRLKGPRAVLWHDYRLNLQGTKFTVQRGEKGKKVIIWDLFKFFQAKFVGAIKDWKVGDAPLWERMALMKDKRSEFDKESRDSVRDYCYEECRCMAELAHKLIDAHERVGLKLTAYYGAGSSGGAMLNVMGIKEKIKPPIPEMRDAVARAFFGGRFENSVIGGIREPLDGWDISSAYPYHITFLPCLEHGFWKRTRKESDLEHSRHALVRYSLEHITAREVSNTAWGPFPFRVKDGTSCYPIISGGGWVWRDEFLQGQRLFRHVRFREAWVYDCQCECQPFSQIPLYYLERLRIGKEGPGIVLKLGCNSCYGKLAQSIGNAQFNSWIWAGIITSGTRAQILEMLGMHQDPWNMLMVATDGLYTRERLVPPKPRDTGTFDAKNSKGVFCPLGGWENKAAKQGVFFARPGVYFPLGELSEEEKKEIRGRGVGKAVVLDNRDHIMQAFRKGGWNSTVRVANVQRFCGAKTSISHSKEGYHRADHEPEYDEKKKEWQRVKPAYGEWIARPVDMSFNPMPKRDGVHRDGMRLRVRTFARDIVSQPYSRALILKDPDVRSMIRFQLEIEEQPDPDLSEAGEPEIVAP